MGLVRLGVGSGPTAGAVVVSEPSKALGWGLRMHLATSSLPVADVVATRVLLESQAAAHAAAHWAGSRDEIVVEEAAGLLERLKDPRLPDPEFHEIDARFHLVISTLGGNIVVGTILDSLRQATIGYVREGVRNLEDWAGMRVELNRQHQRILEAVRTHQPEEAAEAVRHHIRWFHTCAFSASHPSGDAPSGDASER